LSCKSFASYTSLYFSQIWEQNDDDDDSGGGDGDDDNNENNYNNTSSQISTVTIYKTTRSSH